MSKTTKRLGYYLAIALFAITQVAIVVTSAATQFPAGSLLQPNDVTSSHIRDNTILNVDINSAAAIDPTKLRGGINSGAFFYDAGSSIGTTTKVTYNPSTYTFSSIGSTTLGATTTINGVQFVWPSTQGGGGSTLSNNGSGALSWSSPASGKLSISYVAGETITAGMPVAIGDGSTAITIGNSTTAGSGPFSWGTYYAQKFVTGGATTISQVSMWYGQPGSSFGETMSWQATVYPDSGSGSPNTGAASPGNCSVNAGIQGGTSNSSSATCSIALTAGTFWIVTQCTNGDCGRWNPKEANTATTGYKTSGDGVTWAAQTNDLAMQITFTAPTNEVFQASASANNFRFKGYIGISESSVAPGSTLAVDIAGLSIATTTSVAGTLYYLGNTNGTLTTSAGTNSLKVGLGLSTTGFIIRPDNP